MTIDVLTSANSEQWWNFFHRLPENCQHIHFTPDYHKVLEANGDGQARLFVNVQGDSLFFYPFMLRKINQIGDRQIDLDYQDITSVFGYTGPLIVNSSDKFFAASQNALLEYLDSQNVISEMIRYNPIIKNHKNYTAPGLKNEAVKEYVYIDLPNDPEDLSKVYSSRLQTYLNKADRMEFDVKFSRSKKDVDEFFELYYQHMQDIDVDNYYLFNDAYFDRLYKLIKNHGYLIFSRKNGQILAGLIFLEYKHTSYYHHGARNTDVDNSGLVNKYLFHRAFVRQIDKGLKNCLLGGGASDSPEDSLLKFKKFFTNRSSDFVVGKRVVDRQKYDRIISL
ncbi:MAG TPA: GNAT family N-acetyltransferase [bacterium]|nr:GNAT family N-acetyltransferase [bacterium]